MKLTQPHLDVLARAKANPLGIVEFTGPRGLRHANWHRMMDRLVEAGYFAPYVHGGYEITPKGLEALVEEQ